MEMFIDNGDSVNRFLSSHDTAYRSVYNPRHTHLYTTFTQPGRYVANYKMTARSADGTAIYSSPITPLVWQVGGANPADGTIKDIESAYNAARAERTDGNAATPTLTVSHHAEREHPGDNHLTDITLDTGVATDTGRAWITVNGYFLTEVAVEGGRATVSELLGADAAAVQAIYIPADSASARWISQTVQYSQKDTEPVTVGATDTILGPSNPDPAPVWNPDHLPDLLAPRRRLLRPHPRHDRSVHSHGARERPDPARHLQDRVPRIQVGFQPLVLHGRHPGCGRHGHEDPGPRRVPVRPHVHARHPAPPPPLRRGHDRR